LKAHPNTQAFKLDVSNHPGQLRALRQFYDTYGIRGKGLELCWREMDYGVGQQFSFPLQWDPLKFVFEAFWTDSSWRPDNRVALHASYGHQLPLAAEPVEVLYDR
jgi:hypothetical protein